MVKKFSICFLAILMVFFIYELTFAAQGKVIIDNNGHNYVLVKIDSVYVILESRNGSILLRGDIIAGRLESYGLKDVYNCTTDKKLRIYVIDYWLSWEDALRKYYKLILIK
jgi:hypothetical protein